MLRLQKHMLRTVRCSIFVFDDGTAKIVVANLSSFGGILSKLEAFLALIFFSSFLTCAVDVYGNKSIKEYLR